MILDVGIRICCDCLSGGVYQTTRRKSQGSNRGPPLITMKRANAKE